MNKHYNFPIILTLFRLIFSPILIPVLLVYVKPLNIPSYNLALVIFFIFISLTDFLDGYIARRYNIQTKLGSILDPIADKFLLYSSIIGLLYIQKIYFLWAIIFIGREFFIMTLREISLSNGFYITVSFAGKIKTTFQFLYLTLAILNTNSISIFTFWGILEKIMLFLALFFTVYSALQYVNIFFKQYKN